MQRRQVINREELCFGTSTMSNQRKRSSEEIYYSASEELEMFAEQTGQVPRKRSREEEVGGSTERTGQVPRKRSREEEVGGSTERTGQVPRKRSREEEVGGSTEETSQVPRKRSRYYTASEELQSSTERTGQDPRKRSREEEVGGSTEETGQAPRKRSRYYTASEDLQSCAERKGQKRRWSQDTECESHLRKRRRSEEGADGGTTERVAASTEQAAAPTGYEKTNLTPESFVFHKILGSGAYGTVVLATHIDSGMLVALKIVDKLLLVKNTREAVLVERRALEKVGDGDFCIHAYATFQTENQLFYVMEYLSGGDLADVAAGCDITTLRLTTAELVCGLQFIHSRGIIHRDLKLDNFLIDSTGHIKIADFGIASVYSPEDKMLFDPSMDYFWLGFALCDLAFGNYPILCMRDNAMHCVMPTSPADTDPNFEDLLKKLLCDSKEVRELTISNIRNHPFFQGINWEEVEARETRPPFFVRRKGLRQVTRQKISLDDLLNEEKIPAQKQVLFNGFSFESDQWKAIQKLN